MREGDNSRLVSQSDGPTDAEQRRRKSLSADRDCYRATDDVQLYLKCIFNILTHDDGR